MAVGKAAPMTKIHLGISTCPNDTFTFHGLMERKVDWRGLDFEMELLDVEELNTRLFAGQFDAAKASFHAALLLTDTMGVLPAGSALGYGVGPLLLAAHHDTRPGDLFPSGDVAATRPARVLCPGQHTTATLLYKLFHPGEGKIEQAVFSEIMPALQDKTAEFGVCIHEGRFTWQEQGLALVEDLGTMWEKATGTPLPLGGILARHRLGPELLKTLGQVIHDSLQYGLAHRAETVATMRRYAQELTEEVMFAHVDLYVNQWTSQPGTAGRAALETLSQRAVEAQIIPAGLPGLKVVGE
jgi:1,4-dihydroxy-6-naphthoate synthase